MQRYCMNASNGSVVPIESTTGDWLKYGEVDYEMSTLRYEKEEAMDRIAALTARNERLRDRLKAAENVVSYVVIWGAAPSDKLAELVKRSMRLRDALGEATDEQNKE